MITCYPNPSVTDTRLSGVARSVPARHFTFLLWYVTCSSALVVAGHGQNREKWSWRWRRRASFRACKFQFRHKTSKLPLNEEINANTWKSSRLQREQQWNPFCCSTVLFLLSYFVSAIFFKLVVVRWHSIVFWLVAVGSWSLFGGKIMMMTTSNWRSVSHAFSLSPVKCPTPNRFLFIFWTLSFSVVRCRRKCKQIAYKVTSVDEWTLAMLLSNNRYLDWLAAKMTRREIFLWGQQLIAQYFVHVTAPYRVWGNHLFPTVRHTVVKWLSWTCLASFWCIRKVLLLMFLLS